MVHMVSFKHSVLAFAALLAFATGCAGADGGADEEFLTAEEDLTAKTGTFTFLTYNVPSGTCR
jgi:hypothetical protein